MLLHIKLYDHISIFNKNLVIFILKYSSFSMIMVFCQFILTEYFNIIDSNFINLVYVIFTGLIIYLLLSFIFDRQTLMTYLSNLINKKKIFNNEYY